MKIGVVIASYNGARFILEQLDSITAQTRQPDKLIIVDDHSSDKTVEIIRSFASGARFPVQLLVNGHNAGTTRAFAQAIEACDADIIAMCDQDDIWYPDRLNEVERAFESAHADLVITNAELVDENSMPLGADLFSIIGYTSNRREIIAKGQGLPLFLVDPPYGHTMAFNSRIKSLAVPIPEMCHEHDTWIAVIAAIMGHVVTLPACLSGYRRHSHNASPLPEMSLRISIQQAQGHGRQFYGREAQLYIALLERIPLICSTAEEPLEMVAHKASHMLARANMPACRALRIRAILSELLKGHYRRYSRNGSVSAFRDLILR